MNYLILLQALSLGLAAPNSAQPEFTIRGEVSDATTNTPLVGASVIARIAGTEYSRTTTDGRGAFRLRSPAACLDLEVQLAGYRTETVEQACEGETIRIALSPRSVPDTNRREEKKNRRQEAEMADMQYAAPAPAAGAFYMPSHTMPGEPGRPRNTEDYDLITENRFHRPTDEPLSTFSIDVDAASYSNLRRFIRNGQQPPKDAVRIEEMVNYFTYDYPQPGGEHPFAVITELSECPWQPKHQLLHIGLQGKRIPMDDLPASNLVFLIDASGSMDQPNKLPLLQSSFKLLTDQLRPQDKVSIVVYAGAAGQVLAPTSGSDKPKIKEAITRLRAGGSTAGGAGIQLAYQTAREQFIKGGNNRVILATDGDFNLGTSSDAELVRLIEKERESGIFLTVLGFGMGNYKDNKMQKLANHGNGNHAYIDDIQEARKVLVEEFGSTVFTIAKDVKLQLEFNPAQVAGYRLIGYENRLLNKEDFNNDRKDAGELGSGHTVTALYELIPAGVESDFLADVDPLKYQEPVPRSGSKELCTVKLRYKRPGGDTSRKLAQTVSARASRLGSSSVNFRWSAAVAAFGMLLRDSGFKGEANYPAVVELARGAKDADPNGYRAECIRLMETMQDLTDPAVVGER